MFQNKETAAILVYQTNPPRIELYFYANIFFCFKNTDMAADHVSENALLLGITYKNAISSRDKILHVSLGSSTALSRLSPPNPPI